MDPINPLNSSPPPQKSSNESSGMKTRQETIASPHPLPLTTTDPTAIKLSAESLELKQFQNQLNNLPEIRQERVREVQQAIENGTYAISSKDLANSLIREL